MKHHQIHHENTLLVSEASQASQASPCACLQAVLLRGTTITFQDHQDGIAVAGRPRPSKYRGQQLEGCFLPLRVPPLMGLIMVNHGS